MPVVPISRFPIPAQVAVIERQVPEINGSQGGFIALVVILSVLIVICCAAVFYLLRHHEPTDQDRAIRRERRYRRTREERDDTSITGPSLLGALKQKFKRMATTWRRRPDKLTSDDSQRSGRGWIRTGSGDEWALSHPDPKVGRPPEGHVSVTGKEAQQLSSSSQDKPDTEDNAIRMVESPLSDTGSSGFIPRIPLAHRHDVDKDTEPFSKESPTSHQFRSPLHVDDLGRSQSPLSSSDEIHDHDAPPSVVHYYHRPAISSLSAWTPTGSKFVEDI